MPILTTAYLVVVFAVAFVHYFLIPINHAELISNCCSLQPLLAIDVWEHAYYVDYENRRADYVSVFMEKLVSWEVVSSRLEMAKAWAAERAEEEERKRREEEYDEEDMEDDEAVEMYLESDTDSDPE